MSGRDEKKKKLAVKERSNCDVCMIRKRCRPKRYGSEDE